MFSIETFLNMTIGELRRTEEYMNIPAIYGKEYLPKRQLINLIQILEEEPREFENIQEEINEEEINEEEINEEEINEDDTDCMICLSALGNNKQRLLCCGKEIHIECIRRWEEMRKYTCPHCRSRNYKESRILPPLIRQIPRRRINSDELIRDVRRSIRQSSRRLIRLSRNDPPIYQQSVIERQLRINRGLQNELQDDYENILRQMREE
jgi:hypothetical protein